MKRWISIGALVVFVAVFLFLASAPVHPGGMIPYFSGAGVLGLVPLVVGPSRWLRVLGVLAVYLSIHFSVSDHLLGKREAERLSAQREEWKMKQATSGEQQSGGYSPPAARSSKPTP